MLENIFTDLFEYRHQLYSLSRSKNFMLLKFGSWCMQKMGQSTSFHEIFAHIVYKIHVKW